MAFFGLISKNVNWNERFGSELIFALCEIQNTEIVIINKGEPPTFEEELVEDQIEIITVFSARLYGSRSHKTKRLPLACGASRA
jgi:putative resolvase